MLVDKNFNSLAIVNSKLTSKEGTGESKVDHDSGSQTLDEEKTLIVEIDDDRTRLISCLQPKLRGLDELEFNFKFYYLYVDWEKYHDIFTKRCVDVEPMIGIDGQTLNAIVLLTIPPDFDDLTLLTNMYGSNVPLNTKRVQCCIQFRREVLEQSKKYLVKLGKYKYACLKQIAFGAKFPRHEFRANFAKNTNTNTKDL